MGVKVITPYGGGGGGGGGSSTWGSITGTLSNQTDLQTALSTAGNPTVIASQTVTGASVASVTFSSLDLSEYYKVELICRSVKTTAGSNQQLRMQVNDVTSAVYAILGSNDQTSSIIGIAWAAAGDRNVSNTVVEFDRPGVVGVRKTWTSKARNFTTTLVDYSNACILQNQLAQATREAAITKIKIFSATGNIDVDSKFELLGYKK